MTLPRLFYYLAFFYLHKPQGVVYLNENGDMVCVIEVYFNQQ